MRRTSSWASLIAALIFGLVVIHEWAYRSDHPHALGPSGELIALGIAGALLSIAIHAIERDHDAEAARQRRETRMRLEELQEEVDRLRADALDDRILLHAQLEPEDLREWLELFESAESDEPSPSQ